jgi:hypothetical protein
MPYFSLVFALKLNCRTASKQRGMFAPPLQIPLRNNKYIISNISVPIYIAGFTLLQMKTESKLMLRTKYSEKIEKQMKAYFDSLNEKDRRGYAAIEAMKLGHGGQK